MSRFWLMTVSLTLAVLFGCAPNAPVYPPADNSTASADNSTASADNATASSAIPPSARVPRITIDELLQKINSHADILIVDSRIDVEKLFDAGHIPGAIPVPLSEIIDGKWLPPADKEIIFYCT